jgi:glycosyltransferase involved in cell wall biosynthesis
MNQCPLVSIIIPSYNDSHVVCDAIDSSLNQTHENCEIIVIDDGSIDGTQQILKEKYGDKIRYIIQQNKGLASARNAGIRHASGKYLQFLDADDLIDKNKINIQIKALQNIAGKALAYCDYICSDVSDITITYEGRLSPVLQKEKPFDDIMMKWETDLSIPIHCFLFDSELFKKYEIAFNETLENHEDWDCWMNIFALQPEIVFIEQPLANYRIRKESMCRDKVKMREGYISAIDMQIHKNKMNETVSEKLKMRKRQVKYFYRNESLLIRLLERCHPIVRKLYHRITPYRIQRIFD